MAGPDLCWGFVSGYGLLAWSWWLVVVVPGGRGGWWLLFYLTTMNLSSVCSDFGGVWLFSADRCCVPAGKVVRRGSGGLVVLVLQW
jgi:hypothetical protein